jgi:Na+/H+-translocating membrane pyrophosphatase
MAKAKMSVDLRMAVVETKLDTVIEQLKGVQTKLDGLDVQYVHRREFENLQKLIYTGLGIIATALIGIIFKYVFHLF